MLYNFFLKRMFDLILTTISFILLSPVFVIVAICLFVVNKGNPFFFQKRPGLNEKTFSIIKFKSMNDEKDNEGNLLPDKERLTKVGSFIRKTSLDELPQLINVIKGDMSIIGPRPLLVNYLSYYTKRETLRHSVRPGITGLAQVSGRNTINWDERLELDVQYVENLSFVNDFKILFKTIKNVLNRKDIIIVPGDLYTTLDKHRKNEN